jgi:hypothetical protein
MHVFVGFKHVHAISCGFPSDSTKQSDAIQYNEMPTKDNQSKKMKKKMDVNEKECMNE